MYKRIMVPVDLEHTEALTGALSIAGQMAEMCGGELFFACVHGGGSPGVAQTEAEFTEQLDAFARKHPFAQIGKVSSLPIFTKDPGHEIAPALIKAAADNQMELIVMASHMPSWAEHAFHSNAGYVASHATMSVFVVR